MVVLNELIVFCVRSALCDELIARQEVSYRVCVCVCVCIECDLETLIRSGFGPFWAVTPQKIILFVSKWHLGWGISKT